MASASCSDTPNDTNRHRGGRLDFEPPSFSLGIDSEIFGSAPSFDVIPESSSGRVDEEEEEKKKKKKSWKLKEEIVLDTESEDDSQQSEPEQQRRVAEENEEKEEEEKEKKSWKLKEKIVLDTESEDDSQQSGPEQQTRVVKEDEEEEEEKEKKSWKLNEDIVLDTESEDDFQQSAPEQQRRFKRLKRGPSSAGTERRLKGARDLSRKTDISARKRSKDLSESRSQLYKEPLPLLKDFRNPVPAGINTTGVESRDFGQAEATTGSGDRVLPSASAHRSGLKRTEPEPSLATEAVPRSGSQRNGRSTGGAFSFNKEPLPSVHNVGNNPPRSNVSASCNGLGDMDDDDIEEFSDDELFGSVSRTQRDRRSLRPQLSQPSPILLSSSPETSQKGQQSQKPVPKIPGVDFPPKVPLRLSQPTTAEKPVSAEDSFWKDDFVSGSGVDFPLQVPSRSSQPTAAEEPISDEDPFWMHDFVSRSGVDLPPRVPLPSPQPSRGTVGSTSEEDPFWMQDFVSESGWRRANPDLSRQYQTPQPAKKSTSDGQRALNSAPNLFKTFQRDPFRETNFNKSFHTDTPARKDIVGPSQALRNPAVDQTNADRIVAFLCQRFPHYKPVDALLVDGGLDNEPVYIDYRRQFAEGRGRTEPQSGHNRTGAGARWSPVRSINEALCASPLSNPARRRNGGRKNFRSKSHTKKQNPGKASSSAGGNSRPGKPGPGRSGEGKWITRNGTKVFILDGQQMSGQRAYSAYKKRAGAPSSKKSKKKRRQSKKSK